MVQLIDNSKDVATKGADKRQPPVPNFLKVLTKPSQSQPGAIVDDGGGAGQRDLTPLSKTESASSERNSGHHLSITRGPPISKKLFVVNDPSPRAVLWLLAQEKVPQGLKPCFKSYMERAYDPDDRSRVPADDINDGGKYRSILKVFTKFPNGEWYEGTGYLVAPDIVVTAAHNVYDSKDLGGAAVQIVCVIGFNGLSSAGLDRDARCATMVATHDSWVHRHKKRNDVAFIKLDRAFDGALNVLEFINTPPSATMTLTVVGFPSEAEDSYMNGEHMYQESKETTYKVDKEGSYMLTYHISTSTGQSGSPILAEIGHRWFVIGTHCYGYESEVDPNFGTSIGGRSGNDYKAFLKVLHHAPQGLTANTVYSIPL